MTMPEVPSDRCPSFRRPRPGGLTAICVIAIVLGGLGLASSLMTLASLAARPWLQQTIAGSMPPQRSQKLRDAQLAMQEQIETVNRRYETLNWGFGLANLAVSAALLAGGIMALRRRPKARKFLIAVLAVTILVEVLRAVVHVVMQLAMMPVIAESMSRMMAAAPHGASGASQGAAIAMAAAKVGALPGHRTGCGLAAGQADLLCRRHLVSSPPKHLGKRNRGVIMGAFPHTYSHAHGTYPKFGDSCHETS